MRFALAFLSVLSFQVLVLHTLFIPGFLSPDLLLVLLLTKAYLSGREAVLWAVLGGALLDIVTDTLGLNLSLEVLSVYLFVLIYERFIFRSALVFVVPASLMLLVKKVTALLMMRFKFSFDVSPHTILVSWTFEILVLLAVYFLYIRRRE